jgi:hypothetical protein
MGAILELTSYAATPVGMVAIIVIGAAAYFGARWIFADWGENAERAPTADVPAAARTVLVL